MNIETYCAKWSLTTPTKIASTFTSEVYKVQTAQGPAVLKILNEKGRNFEVHGATVLKCFNGHGAVKILNADEGAHLLEFINGPDLKTLVNEGRDDEATNIICDVINKLHQYRGDVPENLISMERNFRSLYKKVETEPLDSIYVAGLRVAERLMASPVDPRVLHGDLHHENILLSPSRGWLAIDPQCLYGERTYDLANTFYNPNGFDCSVSSIERRCQIFSSRLELDPRRILEYAFAYGCLSAAWCLEDGRSPDATFRVAFDIYLKIK